MVGCTVEREVQMEGGEMRGSEVKHKYGCVHHG